MSEKRDRNISAFLEWLKENVDVGNVEIHNFQSFGHGLQAAKDLKNNEAFSKAVSKALDRIGVNQMMRKRFYEHSVIRSIAGMFLHIDEDNNVDRPDELRECFGSSVEGTTSYRMGSDIDYVIIAQDNVIELTDNNNIVPNEKTVAFLTDMFTPPGYVKLKITENHRYSGTHFVKYADEKQFLSNRHENLFADIVLRYSGGEQCELQYEHNGPAFTVHMQELHPYESTDTIIAFNYKSSISFTRGYFQRLRKYGWPSQSTLKSMEGQGCLFVPKGHAFCDEKYKRMQWRISFSFQERHLMLDLNVAQYKTYVLLKLIKKTHISPVVGLTSYHCKTALFYTIENNSSEIWKEKKLFDCLILCLKRLKKWSKQRYCPNYFLPEQNLFNGKIEEKDMCKLENVLSELISSPIYYLRKVSTDFFGRLVELYTMDLVDEAGIEACIDSCTATRLIELHFESIRALLAIRDNIFKKISSEGADLNEIISRHYKWLKTLASMQERKLVGNVSLASFEWVLPHVCMFIHSSLGSHLAIKAIHTECIILKSWDIVAASYHYWMGLNSDALSGKLKLATLLLYTGNLKLDMLELWGGLQTYSMCRCAYDYMISKSSWESFVNMFKASPEKMLKLETSEFMQKNVSVCSVFLPSEEMIMPRPLKFERYRYFGCRPSLYETVLEPKFKIDFIGYNNSAILDSKMFLVLLRAYTSDTQGKESEVQFLQKCSISDNFSHKETTLNILGWLECEKKVKTQSLLVFARSLDYHMQEEHHLPRETRTKYNTAVKWHLVLLLYQAWCARTQ